MKIGELHLSDTREEDGVDYIGTATTKAGKRRLKAWRGNDRHCVPYIKIAGLRKDYVTCYQQDKVFSGNFDDDGRLIIVDLVKEDHVSFNILAEEKCTKTR
jgi:hypothetical protein